MTERDLLDRLIHRWHARFHGVDTWPQGADMLPILEALVEIALADGMARSALILLQVAAARPEELAADGAVGK